MGKAEREELVNSLYIEIESAIDDAFNTILVKGTQKDYMKLQLMIIEYAASHNLY